MRKVLGLILVATLLFMGVSLASDITVSSNGTYVKQASGVNFKGPAVTDNGTGVDVDLTAVTGAQTITGSLKVGTPTIGGTLGTNYLAVANGVEVDGDIYVDGATKAVGDVFADGSIYLTATAPAAAAGVGLWISQPDGGCSKCYVDAAGTTWACANATCPTGM